MSMHVYFDGFEVVESENRRCLAGAQSSFVVQEQNKENERN